MATSLKINQDLMVKVQHLAEIKNRSAHWVMCEAIRNYVEKEEAYESFKQEAIDSWTHYCETGLHVSMDELQEWLNKWGDEALAQGAPKCHE